MITTSNWRDHARAIFELAASRASHRTKVYDTVKIVNEKNHSLKGNFIGDNCLILCHKLIMKPGSQINANSILEGRCTIYLGRNTVVGYGCLLMTSTDTPRNRYMNDSSPEEERACKHADIIVEDNAFVGSHSIIMPGVTIGSYSVVGAGSYINKNIAPKTVVIPKQELVLKPRTI